MCLFIKLFEKYFEVGLVEVYEDLFFREKKNSLEFYLWFIYLYFIFRFFVNR